MNLAKRLLAVGGATAVGPLLAATSASAAGSSMVKATTHVSHHPDTTNCVTSQSSPNGPVWAYDNLSRQFTVTSSGGDSYTVVVTDNGSFSAFDEPNNSTSCSTEAVPTTATGSVRGTITYDVTATQGPDPSQLPSQVPSNQSTSATIDQLFGGSITSFAGGDYSYTYKAGGDTYTQNTSGTSGNIG